MTLSVLLQTLFVAATDSSLDLAGAALLPGAWPILRSALIPVLDRLGGYDVLISRQRAVTAAQRFAADAHLQEMLRSRLLQQLDSWVPARPGIDADVERLMGLAAQRISSSEPSSSESSASAGSPAASAPMLVQAEGDARRAPPQASESPLIEKISRQAWSCRKVRACANRELGSARQIVQRQLERLQIRCGELLRSGAIDLAREELHEAVLLVAMLLGEAPTDTLLRIHLACLQRMLAEVARLSGHATDAHGYLESSDEILRVIREDAASDPAVALEAASTLQRVAHIDHQRRNLQGAIATYRLALAIDPDHVSAWHDLFSALHEQATQGRPDLVALRRVLTEIQRRARGRPELGAQHLARLERSVEALERAAAHAHSRSGRPAERASSH